MRIYPAIDIIGGKCVRLVKGDYSQKTTYAENPVDVAKKWESLGCEFIHVVDLDGAKSGDMPNFELISNIASSVSVPIEVGGGIRDMNCIDKYLGAGIERVILGTSALRCPELVNEAVEKYGSRIAVGIDAKDGMVAVSGWEDVSNVSAIDFAKQMEQMGVKYIIYTDIATDGMLMGPNISAMKQMIDHVNVDIIASGGVTSLDDVEKLAEIGAHGAIIGKALYTNNIDLKEAILKGR
ncbi:MAG: 1-(5-phosphoribosyl)-5-[(5-phosphoribosylamino)methylideneamino]imidazole-4-carboxamide isomerase [Clostridiales bacterium]|nr:1-(5-phosphoribosyl)-5-[(5-phosphoribosylamino)methylideneamino]imidazole-4-carboxamide isomerase [Clostridiales bacterium]